MYYNFGRIHKNLRVTPAMAAGVTDMFGLWKKLRHLQTELFCLPNKRSPLILLPWPQTITAG